jgi:tetratricopeptide (TPR) repeat protein
MRDELRADLDSSTNQVTTEDRSLLCQRKWRSPKLWILILVVALVSSLVYQEASDPWRTYHSALKAMKGNNQSTIEQAVAKLTDVSEYKYHVEYLKGVLALRAGDFPNALKHAETARLHPDVAVDANVLAGESAYKMGASGNAKIYWEQALDMNPDSVPAHQWLGVLYYDVGAMSDALIHLQSVSRLSPNDPRPDRLMGLMNRDYERPEAAIPHYQESEGCRRRKARNG